MQLNNAYSCKMIEGHVYVKNIFLADDDADDRSFFEDALKLVSIPTQLTVSIDGFELMNNLESVLEPPPPHIIFLDLNMPRKNGFECLQEIRKTPKLKNIPIVIFSTTSNAAAVDKTYDHGANYYICKPRSFQLLVKAIETILNLEMWQAPQAPKEKFVLAIA
jgi:CheY-like chemotaxis protein